MTLIDLENGTGACATDGDKATNTVIRGTVPDGDYVGIRMYLGVPFALNHTDIVGAPRPLDLAAMSWSWQYGPQVREDRGRRPGRRRRDLEG